MMKNIDIQVFIRSAKGKFVLLTLNEIVPVCNDVRARFIPEYKLTFFLKHRKPWLKRLYLFNESFPRGDYF